jgi:ribose-phosphate pyrophosphokinase
MIKVSARSTENSELQQVDLNFHTFSGGEEHVSMETFYSSEIVHIDARLDSSRELIRLLLVTDSLRRMGNKRIDLFIPYIPYARQDRVCQPGDAFSLKVFTDIINSQNYEAVYVADAHSMVATALLNNVVEFTQDYYALDLVDFHAPGQGPYDYIIAPDAGASKKAVSFSKYLNTFNWDTSVVQALKVRDKMGDIVNTQVLFDDFKGASCLIVDDIIDGGRTFTELALALKEKNAGKIGLYVTHGIFSKGVDVIFDHNIDEIYTTDSFEQVDPRVNVIHNFF